MPARVNADEFARLEVDLDVSPRQFGLIRRETLQSVHDSCQPRHISPSRQHETQWRTRLGVHGRHEEAQKRRENFYDISRIVLPCAGACKKRKSCPDRAYKLMHWGVSGTLS
jgi:hypothetical protein